MIENLPFNLKNRAYAYRDAVYARMLSEEIYEQAREDHREVAENTGKGKNLEKETRLYGRVLHARRDLADTVALEEIARMRCERTLIWMERDTIREGGSV